MNTKSRGRRVEMVVNGKVRTLGTIGALADAMGRKPHTLRQWEREGLIPHPPLVIETGDERTRRRLYPAELISAMERLALTERFGQRRPSGRFLAQQQIIWSTWRSVMDSLIADGSGVGDPSDQ